MRGVPPRAPRLKAPLLLLVWGLPHGVVAPRQEPKIPRSYTRIFRRDGTLGVAPLYRHRSPSLSREESGAKTDDTSGLHAGFRERLQLYPHQTPTLQLFEYLVQYAVLRPPVHQRVDRVPVAEQQVAGTAASVYA